MPAQSAALTIAVEKLRTATTKQAAQAARQELLRALYDDGGFRTAAGRWMQLSYVARRLAARNVAIAEVEHEALLCLAETSQICLPGLGVNLIHYRWRAFLRHMNQWLIHQVAPVQYGDSACRQFELAPWRALPDVVADHADRPKADPAPLGCRGCDGAAQDARGRCQTCRLRRKGI